MISTTEISTVLHSEHVPHVAENITLFFINSEFKLNRLRSPKWELNGGSELMFFIFVSALLSEKNWRPPEASVPLDCVTWPDTHIHFASLYLQWDCLTQAVHTKNSPAVCLTHTRTSTPMHTHTCAAHTCSPSFKKNKFLSVSAATTSVRWAGSTPKGAGWTPVITCLRSSGTQAARWSHSTSRPQVPQHTTRDLWPHTYPYQALHLQLIRIKSTHAYINTSTRLTFRCAVSVWPHIHHSLSFFCVCCLDEHGPTNQQTLTHPSVAHANTKIYTLQEHERHFDVTEIQSWLKC